jgi:hypothetical protein
MSPRGGAILPRGSIRTRKSPDDFLLPSLTPGKAGGESGNAGCAPVQADCNGTCAEGEPNTVAYRAGISANEADQGADGFVMPDRALLVLRCLKLVTFWRSGSYWHGLFVLLS